MAKPVPQKVHIPDPGGIVHGAENVVKGVESAAKGTAAVGQFLWDPVRVGEALVGLILIAVGINAMLKGSAVADVAKKSGQTAGQAAMFVATKGKA